MSVNHTIPNRRLKPFKQFLAENCRGARKARPFGKTLREETPEESDDTVITGAATTIIGSELSAKERKSMVDGFIKDVNALSDEGYSVIAMAVALDEMGQ